MRKLPLVFLFLFYAMGIVLNHYTRFSLPLWFGLSVLALVISAVHQKNRRSWIVTAVLLFLLGGLNHARRVDFGGSHLEQMEARDAPDSLRATVYRLEKYPDSRARLLLNRIAVKRGQWQPVRGKMLIFIRHYDDSLAFGDRLLLQVSIQEAAGSRNPGEFDYRRYLALHGTYRIAYLDESAGYRLLQRGRPGLRRAAQYIRKHIEKLIDRSMSGEPNAILKALIVGVRSEISESTKTAFIDSGVIHVLAVSGLHVGYVTLAFLTLFGFLRIPNRLRNLLTIGALIFYMLMVDCKPSVVRAVIMASCILYARAYERDTNIYNTLAGAALIQTLIDPLQLFDVGFQLSFTAVFSIVYIYRWIWETLPALWKEALQDKTLALRIVQLFLVSLSALIGTLPLTAYYFHRIPLISLLVNLLVVPLVGLIAALGFAQILLGALIPFVNIAYGELQMLLITGLRGFIRWSAGFSFAYLSLPQIYWIWVPLAYGVIFCLMHWKWRQCRFALLTALLVMANIWIWHKAVGQKSLLVTFLDVGQGDAAVFECPAGLVMVIDCGDRSWQRDYGENVVGPYLERRAISRIHYLLLTHPHSDHIGGAPYLLRHFRVDTIYQTEIEGRSSLYDEIQFLADSLEIPVKILYAGDQMAVGKMISAYCLHPGAAFYRENVRGYNDHSIVLKVSHGDVDFLMTGDIEECAERHVSHWGAFLQSEILKVPHHGSATSSTAGFLHTVNPDRAVISVGACNRFDHPAKGTLKRYERMEIPYCRTDRDGAVVIRSNGSRYHLVQWKK